MDTALLAHDAPGAIARAVALLAAGEPVALPTETVYGLAGDALNPAAAAAIFQAKERPFFDPLIVHLPDRSWLGRLAESQPLADRLADRFWPGPLTLLLPRRPGAVPDLVTAGSALVAVRISAHPVFARVIARFGGPLAAPSANRFGRISPTSGGHAWAELGGRIPLVVDAGPTAHGLESTIVAFGAGGVLRILRHGPITAETLAEFGPVALPEAAEARSAPGQLAGHYAPRTPLTLLGGGAPEVGPGRVGLLAFRRDAAPEAGGFARVECLSEAGDLREAAAHLFAALRRLDGLGLERIYAQGVPERGLGAAIMERLRRAAAGSGASPIVGSDPTEGAA